METPLPVEFYGKLLTACWAIAMGSVAIACVLQLRKSAMRGYQDIMDAIGREREERLALQHELDHDPIDEDVSLWQDEEQDEEAVAQEIEGEEDELNIRLVEIGSSAWGFELLDGNGTVLMESTFNVPREYAVLMVQRILKYVNGDDNYDAGQIGQAEDKRLSST